MSTTAKPAGKYADIVMGVEEVTTTAPVDRVAVNSCSHAAAQRPACNLLDCPFKNKSPLNPPAAINNSQPAELSTAPFVDLSNLIPTTTPAKVTLYSLMRSASQEGRVRSTSINRGGALIQNADRNIAGQLPSQLTPDQMADFSIVAVYSREAAANFAAAFANTVYKGYTTNRVTKFSLEKSGYSSDENLAYADKMVGPLAKDHIKLGVNVEEQLRLLLQNRMIPHVIVITEGNDPEMESITIPFELRDKDVVSTVEVKYEFAKHYGKLAVQKFTVFVRADMTLAYEVSSETINLIAPAGRLGNNSTKSIGRQILVSMRRASTTRLNAWDCSTSPLALNIRYWLSTAQMTPLRIGGRFEKALPTLPRISLMTRVLS